MGTVQVCRDKAFHTMSQDKHLEKANWGDQNSPADNQNLSKIFSSFMCVCVGGGQVGSVCVYT